MPMDEYARALQWARSGQAARWGPQTGRRQLLNHLAKHHGHGDLSELTTPELAAKHDAGHSGGYGDGVNRAVRGKEHHHEPYSEDDAARDHMLAQARMQQNQLYRDRRDAEAGVTAPPRRPAGRGPRG